MKTFLLQHLTFYTTKLQRVAFSAFLLRNFLLPVALLLSGMSIVNGQTIGNVVVTNGPVCAGSNVTVNFDVTNGAVGNLYTNATVYTVYLSSAAGTGPYSSIGTFTSGVAYNTTPLTGVTNITGSVTIPGGTTAGSTYNVSIGSGTPAFDGSTGVNASSNFTVNSILPASVIIASNDADNIICAGTSVTFTATPTNGGTTPSYQWQVNGLNVGINSTTYTSTGLTNGQVVTVVMTSNATCATGNPATSTGITMTVNPNLPVSVSISASATAICAGTSVTFTATPTNAGATPSYQWKVDGSNVGTNSTTYTTTGLTNDQVVTVVLTSNATCATGNPATSTGITMTVNPNLPVSVSISASATTICAGTSVTFTATPTNGGTTPSYQWKIDGSNVGTNSTTYTSSGLTNGQVVTVVMTSNATCATGNPATSTGITMTVNPNLPVSVSIASNDADNIICAGASVTFTATPTNGGTTPSYQWKVNGVNAGTGSTYTTTGLTNGQVVTVVMTSNATCATGSPATSNAITTTVNPNLTISVSIVSNDADNNICAGTSVTFTATPVNGGTTPSYQWYIGATPVGTNSPTYTTTSLANTNQVKVVMTSNSPCVTTTTATSNIITITVNPLLTPTVSIIATQTTFCAGTSVTFSVDVLNNGGLSPTYLWRLNGSAVAGANSSSFTSTTLSNNDIITLDVTSSATCATPAMVTSNAIQVTVNPNLPVSVSIASNDADNIICSGTSVTFTATPTNGGTTPAYQWKVNGSNVGTNSTTYTTTGLTNGQVVTVVMTSNATCATGNPATSTGITMTVNPNLPVSVSIVSNDADNIICAGTSVTFTATPTNGGTPTYQWYVGATPVGTNSTSYTTTGLTNGQVVTVVMTSNATCATGNPATSTGITMTVNPNLPVSVSIAGTSTICAGTSVTFTATPTNGGTTPAYQWKVNGSNVGTNSPTYTTTGLTNGQVVTVVMTSNATCATGSPATSNAVTMTVNPNLPVSVSIAGTSTICAGTSVTFTATPTNGGTTPAYQWKVNGSNVGTNSPTYTSTGLTNGQVVTVVMTSNATCAIGNPATSTGITMTVNPILPVSVSIAGISTICAGTSATFTATPTNGGTTPAYQWQVDGSNVGTNSTTYTSTGLTNGQVVTVVMTSNAICATGSPATSNAVTMTVNPNLPVSVSIVSDDADNIICAGNSVTFTATPTNGGTTPSYQWKVGATNVGSNSPTYTTTGLTNGQIVTVVMTSNATCATGNPATSNAITMTVNPNLPVSVSIAGTSTICAGTSVTFTATPTNGGTTPAYQWYVGATPVGINSPTYTTTGLTNGQVVTVVLTSNAICATGSPATSNPITMTVNPVLTPSVSITSTSTSICSSSGTSVTFTATPTNGGSTPTYQWRRNGVNIAGATSSTYTTTSLANPSTITVVLTSNATCASPTTATSNSIVMTVYTGNAANIANGSISGPQSICPPAAGLVYIVTAVSGAASYVWTLPTGFTITSGAGTNTITVSVSSGASIGNGQNVTVFATNPCGPGNSRTLNVNVNSFAGINAGPDQNVCAGGTVTLAGVWSGNTSSSTWTASSGTFSDPTLVNSTYTPSISSGNVSLTLTTNDPSGVCSSFSDQMIITVNQPPAITTQPATPQTVCSGTNVTFSVTATGTGLTYQWRKGITNLVNGGIVSGASTSTLTLTGVSTADAGNYNVVVSGLSPCPSVTSTDAVLVVNQVIAISSQPVSITRCTGGSASFSVTATGTGLTYQWYNGVTPLTNGGNITGATSATLTINPVALADASADYHVVVSGTSPCTPLTSSSVSLTVNEAVVITLQPVTPQTVCSGSTVSFSVTATGTGLTYQWRKGVTNLTNGGNISGATSSTLTLTNVVVGDGGSYNVVVSGLSPCASATSNDAVLTVNQVVAISSQPVSITRCTGGSASFSVTAFGTGLTYQWYNGGTSLTNSGTISGATSATLTINPVALTDASADYHVVVSGTSPCTPLTSSSVSLTVNEAVVIISQPVTPQTACSGSTVNFSVTATGSSLTYQWRKGVTNLVDGGIVSGASTSTLTLTGVSTADAGNYNVVVSGLSPCPSVTSTDASLVVNQVVAISSQPVSITRCTGGSASFSVTASGTGLTYQWYNGGTSLTNSGTISGATSATLTINPVGTADASIDYHVVVSGTSPCTPLTSNSVSLTVNEAVVITLQPVTPQTACSGSTVNFSVTATGTGLTYQWRKGVTNLVDGGNISGATSSTLTLTNVVLADGGSYNVVVSGLPPCASVTSASSDLTVYQVVAITTQPAATQTVCSGSSVSFTVVATGTGLTYQWRKGTTNISGATSATLTINPVALTDAATDYNVVITGTAPCTPVTSNNAALIVNEVVAITSQPAATQTVCSGTNVSFSVTATGTGLTYQWRKGVTNLVDGGNISGATSSILTLANIVVADAATNYNVVITGTSPCTPVTSNNAILIVNKAVSINTQPSNMGVCASNPALFGVVASGDGLTYQWYKGTFPGTAVTNTATITGAQSNILNFSQAFLVDDGIYYVVVSGLSPCASVKSNEVTLNVDQSISITTQPVAQTVCEGVASVSFSVTANAGGDPLTYQWRKNGVNIPGATTATYTIATVTLASAGNYDVVIAGAGNYTCPNVTSLSIALTVTPTVGTPTAITVAAGTEPVCQLTDGITTTTYATTATNSTGFNWSVSNAAAGTINATTGVMTWANGFFGSVNIQVTANGCNGPSAQVVRSVAIGPTLGTPTGITVAAGTEPACQLTNGTTTTTYAITASNNTGFNWSVNNAAAGTINATTGVMAWANGFSGSVNIQVTANGCNGPSAQVVRSVTVTPTVGTPDVITVAAGTQPTCQLTNGTTTTTYATTASNNTGYNWSLSNAAAGSINSTTGVMTWANGFSGSVNIQVTANGCNGPSAQVIRNVTITPTVGSPSAISVVSGTEPACQITSATPTTTYAITATNNTGLNWTISNPAAGSINSSGVMTWTNGFSGSVNIQVTADGCNGPSAQVIRSVTVIPTVGTPVFSLGSTSARCKSAGTITYTATATTNTGITYSLDAASVSAGNSIIASTGVVTYVATWFGTSVITASATGCNGPVNSTHTVITSPTSVGGSLTVDGLTPAVKTVCPSPLSTNSGTMVVSGHTGSVYGWESSNNGGSTWSALPANTTTTQTFSNLSQSTIYRAVIKSGTCNIAYSEYAVISVVPPYPPSPVTASPSEICLGQSSTLTAGIGYPVNGITDGSGTFDQANLNGWCVDGQCTANSLPASGNNTFPAPWQETNGPKVFEGITYDTYDNTKFAITSGAFTPNSTTILETPAFSLIGLPSASLEFFHAFYLTAGATISIDISTDSGATYPITLQQFTGPASYGITGTVATLQSVNISLNNYLGLQDIRIRFKYVGSVGSSWGIDGIQVPNSGIALTYIWSDPSSPTTLNQTTGTTVIATPTVTTTYNIATTVAGCPGGIQPVTVIVNQLTAITPAPIPSLCFSANAQSTSLPYSNAINNPLRYSITWNSTPTNTFVPIVNANLPNNSVPISIPANTSAGTYTGIITVVNNKGCNSPGYSFTITIIAPVVVSAQPATAPICLHNTATIVTAYSGTAAVNQWQVSTDGGTNWSNISDGIKYSGTSTPTLNVLNTSIDMIDYQYRNKITSTSPCNDNINTETARLKIMHVWLGTVSTDWQNGANWSDGVVPDRRCDTVHILNRANQPTLNSGTSTIINLLIYNGAYFTLGNQPTTFIEIARSIVNNSGTFNALDGRIVLNGKLVYSEPAQTNIKGSLFLKNIVNYLTISNETGVSLLASGPWMDTLNISNHLNFGPVNARTFTTNANLTLMSRLDRTASVGDLTNNGVNTINMISGDVIVERYLPAKKAWRFLATPVQPGKKIWETWQESGNNTVAVKGFGTQITGPIAIPATNGLDVYTQRPSMKHYIYDALDIGYLGIIDTRATNLTNDKGYMIFVRGDRSATVASGTSNPTILRSMGKLITDTKTYGVQGGTDTSVGNPYASRLDLQKVFANGGFTGITATVTTWDPVVGGGLYAVGYFRTYTRNGAGDFVETPGGGINNYIESGQAFFVQTATGGTFTVGENMKGLGSLNLMRSGDGSDSVESQLRTNLYGPGYMGPYTLIDGILTNTDKDYVNTIDNMDVRKTMNTAENISIAKGGKELIVERRKPYTPQDTVFYRITGLKQLAYRLEFVPENLNQPGLTGYLEDAYLQSSTEVSLTANTTISFTVNSTPASAAANRFRLVFRKAVVIPKFNIVSITANRNADRSIAVKWKVENEINIQKYTIERSVDGVNFTGIITIDGTNSGSYTQNDLSPLATDNYYRIKATTYVGQDYYSEKVKVSPLETVQYVTVYPNPVTDKTINIRFVNQEVGNYHIELTNKLGQVVYTTNSSVKSSKEVLSFRLGQNTTAGIYQLTIVDPANRKIVQEIMIH